jgi:hypothetical protein
MLDWDGFVKELLVVFPARPEQGMGLIFSPAHQAFQKPPPQQMFPQVNPFFKWRLSSTF